MARRRHDVGRKKDSYAGALARNLDGGSIEEAFTYSTKTKVEEISQAKKNRHKHVMKKLEQAKAKHI